MPEAQQFTSDNYSGICPEAWAAMREANEGNAPAYGDDRWSAEAVQAIQAFFDTDCAVYFLFNGTGSNALALSSMCQPYESVLGTSFSHVGTDECGALEYHAHGSRFEGLGEAGKLRPAMLLPALGQRGIHSQVPRAVTISQATETGEVYSAGELGEIGAACRDAGLRLHMDGARFANACAATCASPADLSWKAGVDVLSLGGTKNGMAIGDAVIFFDRELAAGFDRRRKQASQLASKMRFLSAPWAAMLPSGAWLRHAGTANANARLLAASIAGIENARLTYPVDANAVFLSGPAPIWDNLRERGWRFHGMLGADARFVFSWNSEVNLIRALADDIRAAARMA